MRRTHRRYVATSDVDAARSLRLAICIAALAMVAALVTRVAAEPRDTSRQPIEAILRAKLAPAMPAGLGIARIYLPASLAKATADPTRLTIELPRELRAGRPNIKVSLRGHTTYVPVAISPVTEIAVAQRALAAGDVIAEDDLAFEQRAVVDFVPASPATVVGATVINPIAIGAAVTTRDVARPPPLARGTQVAVHVQRGSVRIRGTGILELAARPGEPASARLSATKVVVHGRLVAPATLIVGE